MEDLLIIRKNIPAGVNIGEYHGKDEWELVEVMLKELKPEVILPDDKYYIGEKNHWIPNTGEKLSGI